MYLNYTPFKEFGCLCHLTLLVFKLGVVYGSPEKIGFEKCGQN